MYSKRIGMLVYYRHWQTLTDTEGHWRALTMDNMRDFFWMAAGHHQGMMRGSTNTYSCALRCLEEEN